MKKKALSLYLAIMLLILPLIGMSNALTTSAEISAPENSQTAGELVGTLFGGLRETTYSTNSNNTIFNISVSPTVDISSVNSSLYGLIEFDLYVEDAESLKAAMIDAGITFRVFITKSGVSARDTQSKVPVQRFLKNDGWNHVILTRSEFSSGGNVWDAVNGVQIRFDKSFAAANGITMAVANICGTANHRTTESTVGTKIAQLTEYGYYATLGDQSTGVITHNPIEKKNVGSFDANTPIFNNAYIEFDIYIEDYDSFASFYTGSQYLYFYVTSNTTSATANYLKYYLGQQITKSGWNHIVLFLGSANTNNFARPLQTDGFNRTDSNVTPGVIKSLCIQNSQYTATTDLSYSMVIMSNIIFSQIAVPEDTTVGSTIATRTVGDNGIKTGTLGSNFTSTIQETNLADPVDFSRQYIEQIEFDFFVESYGVLKKRMAEGGVNNISLYMTSGDYFGSGSYVDAGGFLSQVTQSGWNHIVLPRTSWQSFKSGNSRLSSFNTYRVLFRGTTSASNSDARMVIGITNIQGTTNVAFKSHSLVLDENIGINFLMDLSSLDTAGKNASYMTFAVTNTEEELTTEFADTFTSGDKIGFTCPLNILQIAETVIPTFHFGDGVTLIGDAYSVQDYIGYITSNQESFSESDIEFAEELNDRISFVETIDRIDDGVIDILDLVQAEMDSANENYLLDLGMLILEVYKYPDLNSAIWLPEIM